MKTINKILVAIDFSEYSLWVAKYAIDLAHDVEATLLFANIYNKRDVDILKKIESRYQKFSSKKYIDEYVNDRKERLEKMTQELNYGNLKVETLVRIGVPHEALLEVIKEKKPDLLVIGTKGRSNLLDTVIGACAQKMFRRSPIPVLSIREKNR
jgi:nucleotide-binding universal stress UspA family protein